MMRLLACVLALAACGGDDDGDFCAGYTFTACGGDLLGTWVEPQACPAMVWTETRPYDEDPACADSAWTYTRTRTDLVYTFTAAGTLAQHLTTSSVHDLHLTAACVAAASGGSETLAEACTAALSEGGVPCAVSGDVCACHGDLNYVTDLNDSYTTSGTTVTLNGVDSVEYCVDGETLALADLAASPPAYLVLRRQR